MTLPPEQRIKFFVNIIESPSAPDIYYGRTEGALIQQAVSLNQIPCALRIAISKEAFEYAIKFDLPEVMKNIPDRIPILHISAHGSSNGIQFSNQETLDWRSLRDLLMPISVALNGSLMLCMSSCEGFSACRMAMQIHDTNNPFFAVIGHTLKPTWADTAIAYATFYHLIAKGHYVIDAVNAMQKASGDERFSIITAQAARQAYIEAINDINAENVQLNLEQQAQNTPEPPSAKAFLSSNR